MALNAPECYLFIHKRQTHGCSAATAAAVCAHTQYTPPVATEIFLTPRASSSFCVRQPDSACLLRRRAVAVAGHPAAAGDVCAAARLMGLVLVAPG